MSRASPLAVSYRRLAVLLQRLHDDPVQFATHQFRQLRRLRLPLRRQDGQRLRTAQPVLGLGGSSSRISRSISSKRRLLESFALQRRAARQQLVQQHPQAVNVAARVDVELVKLRLFGLMYSSVPTIAPKAVNSVCSVSFCPVALATPKSITLGTGLPS